MPVRLKVGDLIKVPLSDERVAVGQVVVKRRHGLLVLAFFPLPMRDPTMPRFKNR